MENPLHLDQFETNNAVPSAAERLAVMQRNIPLVLPARTQNLLTTPEFNSIKADLKK